ncbi:5-oxoprolinase (ATP-hydrolyzing) [Candidatus Sulfotelmatobacter kueseliae]|uniref:5-oxoprolinase (ATP-hydrolyzing) n=1 Tax=Candidatus Sulfotelmatobacter kueseliae TaxID=2042962 RepID=A0A2U3L656_9BACT|nr:5-oxoprolinase (ATP-hydrolyzing) [Candidatus Sulfotelmatobacter kueseliae]
MRRDPVELEIFKNLYHSIAEEMGAALRRTAFSPNIKERRDYSCAVFDGAGQAIAMGDHMPVHLGSMPMSVRAAIDAGAMEPGDVVMLNDPFRGGTHLPDITLVAPVYVARVARALLPAKARRTQKSVARNRPDFYVASRAHHADVGGAYPGSMGLCREIYQEGVRIPPVKLIRAGVLDRDLLAMLLNNVRTPEEREGDLRAQIAACHTGAERLREVCSRYGMERAQRAAAELLDYSEELMRAFLKRVPAGDYRAEDFMDGDGINEQPVRIAVKITVRDKDARLALYSGARDAHAGRGGSPRSFTRQKQRRLAQDDKLQPVVTVDFTGSDPQVEGSINAVAAITYSACFYVFRCLLAEDVPATAGLMRPIRVISPEGTIVNARPPAAVAGGNVETSQRIVDVLLRALAQAIPDRIPAAASGTMNNLTIGGIDLRSDLLSDDPRAGEPFAYYETVAGGMGARPGKAGVSGVHTHMTNSLNSPAEALEYAYPLRVRRYSLRPESGGAGKFRGGDGIVREIEVLTDCDVTLLADRRSRGPWGLAGGEDGAPGKAFITRRDGSVEQMPGKFSTRLRTGERITIETPGGGGWGDESPDK